MKSRCNIWKYLTIKKIPLYTLLLSEDYCRFSIPLFNALYNQIISILPCDILGG